MGKTLKAYQVSDGDEHGVVVFATNNATARREGGSELGLSFEEVGSCRRTPEFDQYAPGPVPQLAMIDAGWWIECHGCSRRIDGDMYGFDEAFDDEGNDLSIEDFTPVERGRSLYCCARCMARDDASRRERTAGEAAIIEMVLAKYPETIKVEHVYAGRCPGAHWNTSEWQATFTLPGLQHSVRWTGKDRTHVSVARSDAEAFTALYGAKS